MTPAIMTVIRRYRITKAQINGQSINLLENVYPIAFVEDGVSCVDWASTDSRAGVNKEHSVVRTTR